MAESRTANMGRYIEPNSRYCGGIWVPIQPQKAAIQSLGRMTGSLNQR